MKPITSLVLIAVLLLTTGLAHAQQPLSAQDEAVAFKQLAANIPLGSRVTVESRDGRRLKATLMAVSEDGIVVKRESRIPEAAVSIPFARLTRLQRETKSGFSVGKAIGIGLAAGVGAILTMFAIAVSIGD